LLTYTSALTRFLSLRAVRISTVRSKYTSAMSPCLISASEAVWNGRFGVSVILGDLGRALTPLGRALTPLGRLSAPHGRVVRAVNARRQVGEFWQMSRNVSI